MQFSAVYVGSRKQKRSRKYSTYSNSYEERGRKEGISLCEGLEEAAT